MKHLENDNETEAAILHRIREKRETRKRYKLSLDVPDIVRFIEKLGINPGGPYHGYWIGSNRYLEVITGLKVFFHACAKKAEYPSLEAYKYFKERCRINYQFRNDISIIRDIEQSPIPGRKEMFSSPHLPGS